MPPAQAGSQRWIQVAVNRRPDSLLDALRRAGAVSSGATVRWTSPLEAENCCEYRDGVAIKKAGIDALPVRPLTGFWPPRGPVWDAIGRTSDGIAVFVEAKAHIPEAASPGSQATPASLKIITRSLEEARRWYAPKSKADWTGVFYQYANRLGHHYFVSKVNRVPSVLVFLYFLNASEMNGPSSEDEWKGASQLLHAALGLPSHLEARSVFDAFLDVRQLAYAV